jgi:transaldolase
MRKAGVIDYHAFARDLLTAIPDRPISFEVCSDEFGEMERQARALAGMGNNVYVKIPITNTRGVLAGPLIGRLARSGVKLNVTAVFTAEQVRSIVGCLTPVPAAFVSVFAGRIADTGVDPMPIVSSVLELLAPYPHIQVIWASPRELLNIVQADSIGCHVITVTQDLLGKLSLLGKSLTDFSRETVPMFYDDATRAGLSL